MVERYRSSSPLIRSATKGTVSKNVTTFIAIAVSCEPDGNDTSFISFFSACSSGVNRHDDAVEVRAFRLPSCIDDFSVPERTRHVIEDLTFEFLTAKSSSGVAFLNLFKEGGSEVICVVIRPTTGNDAILVVD
jgi:hypothetical protein